MRPNTELESVNALLVNERRVPIWATGRKDILKGRSANGACLLVEAKQTRQRVKATTAKVMKYDVFLMAIDYQEHNCIAAGD